MTVSVPIGLSASSAMAVTNTTSCDSQHEPPARWYAMDAAVG